MISDKQIEDAKKHTNYHDNDILHEHKDCIRICYEFLDAQGSTKHRNFVGQSFALKHLIEKWGGALC